MLKLQRDLPRTIWTEALLRAALCSHESRIARTWYAFTYSYHRHFESKWSIWPAPRTARFNEMGHGTGPEFDEC